MRLLNAFIFAVSVASAAPAIAADKVSLLLDWYVNPNHGPIIIAQEKGYFADQGLEVAVTAPSDPALPPQLVAAGKADLALSYQPQLHMQVAEGLPLRRVGALIVTPLNCLLTRADGPVKTIADLKGRKVGYSVAGVEEALMTAMLAREGLTLDDIEMINVNFSLTPAVMAGQVDAVIGAYRNFELTQMKIAGADGHCFKIEELGVPIYDELIYVANADRLSDAAHRDKLTRFFSAIDAATAYMTANPQEAWTVFSSTAQELQDELNERAWFDTIALFAAEPMALDQARYEAFSRFMASADLISAAQKADAVAVDLTAQ